MKLEKKVTDLSGHKNIKQKIKYVEELTKKLNQVTQEKDLLKAELIKRAGHHKENIPSNFKQEESYY